MTKPKGEIQRVPLRFLSRYEQFHAATLAKPESLRITIGQAYKLLHELYDMNNQDDVNEMYDDAREHGQAGNIAYLLGY